MPTTLHVDFPYVPGRATAMNTPARPIAERGKATASLAARAAGDMGAGRWSNLVSCNLLAPWGFVGFAAPAISFGHFSMLIARRHFTPILG